ncbi:MAG: efflux RND transporter periplasmic adaptor subunit [Acidithiobacillales bacterium]
MGRFRLPSFLLLILILAGCGGGEKEESSGKPATPSLVVRLTPEAIRTAGIQIAVVGEMVLPAVLSLTGTLAARPWLPEEQAALTDAESADAKLRLAEANFGRLSRLYTDGVAARQDRDTARAARDQAGAEAAQADARRANLGLSADSRALERRAKIWGLASLPEGDLARVREGESVEITTTAFPGHRFQGKVVGVSRSADPETRSFTVRIAVEDPESRLRPQMLATFGIAIPEPEGLAVPRSAILLEGSGSFVYVAEDHRFRKQAVVTGASTPDELAVLEGLSAGQRVVVRGAEILESERLKAQLRPADED